MYYTLQLHTLSLFAQGATSPFLCIVLALHLMAASGQPCAEELCLLSLISPISLDSRLKQIFKCLSTQSHSYTNPSCPWSSHLDCSCSHQVDPGVCSLSLLLFRAWKRGLWVTSPRQLFSTRFGFIHRSQTAAWRVAMLAAPWGRCADHLIFNLSC